MEHMENIRKIVEYGKTWETMDNCVFQGVSDTFCMFLGRAMLRLADP